MQTLLETWLQTLQLIQNWMMKIKIFKKIEMKFKFNKLIVGRDSSSLNNTVIDTKSSQQVITKKEVMFCNSRMSNYTKFSNRSNQLSNHQEKHLTKEKISIGTPNNDSTIQICLLLVKTMPGPTSCHPLVWLLIKKCLVLLKNSLLPKLHILI